MFKYNKVFEHSLIPRTLLLSKAIESLYFANFSTCELKSYLKML